MWARKFAIVGLLSMALALPAGVAQATYIDFAGLLGTSFSSPSGTATASLGSYGLSGVDLSFTGQSWYGASSWTAGSDPGAYTAAGLYMTSHRGDYGLSVGSQAGSGSLGGLPATGVNELDSYEGLLLSFSSPVYLSSVTLGNFYNDTNSLSGLLETGWLVLDGQYAVPVNFTVPSGQFVDGTGTGSYAGTYTIYLPTAVQVSTVQFFASSQISGQTWSSDFLVRGVDASATPEPASMVLMGSAAGLLWWRRRRQAQA